MPDSTSTAAPHYTLEGLSTLTLCIVLALTSACGQTRDSNYFPLADGAQWEYTGRFLSATGEQRSGHMTVRVEGATLIRNRRYFKYVASGGFPSPIGAPQKLEFTFYYRGDEGGIYFLPGDELDGTERLAMPLPLKAGERWFSGSLEVTAEHVGTVEAGGRKYRDCMKLTYKRAGAPRTDENYYALGVGLVKLVMTNTTPPQTTTEMTLKSYKL